MEYTLRRLETIEEYRACEQMQREVWGFSDGLDVIPQTQLVTAQKHGGLVLGAFDESGKLHGFCYGFLGRDSIGRLAHCSHMLAVDRAARNAGLGARLKWAQRDRILADGIELMLWTFDPLESVNACLNFHKLGGVSDEYMVNLYGGTTSELHSGTATDRLTVKWFLSSLRVAARARGDRGELAESLASDQLGIPWVLEAAEHGEVQAPEDPLLDFDAPRLRCEIPRSFQAVKAADRGAANAWREATRAVFMRYFDGGYFARECVRTHQTPPRTVYLLERGSSESQGLKA